MDLIKHINFLDSVLQQVTLTREGHIKVIEALTALRDHVQSNGKPIHPPELKEE